MCRVREATLEDTPRLLFLAKQMHAESKRYRRYPVDEEKLTDVIYQLISEQFGCIFIAEENGVIVGMFWGLMSEMFFNRVRISQDLILYTIPERRGSRVAYRLEQYYERWAKEQGVQEIGLAVSADIDNAAAERFYLGTGYRPAGRSFIKEAADV